MPTLRLPLLVLAALLAGCGAEPAPPEEALRAWLAQAEQAAEARDLDALLELVSDDYSDARGYDRDDVARRLRLLFLRQKSVGLLVDVDELSVFRDSAAEVLLTVAMAATNDALLGFSADAWRFEFELRREGGDWRLLAARYGRLGEDLQ